MIRDLQCYGTSLAHGGQPQLGRGNLAPEQASRRDLLCA